MDLPTQDQLVFAGQVMERARREALNALVTGEHVEQVASLVFSYMDSDEGPTAGDVAHRILDYLATAIVAPLIATT